ncbi:P-loop containing nucleoside triphosphate hydrolase protein [Gymnopilus junonius]|uniref:P-loop containing nucleoside triphosphate hydrolase protein n=1 Tax=Gymnopilus junonius TaxID=109634 RepID=A0A9P5TK04_GYMJU|nr:P-loop containing nucleoside triphosphate hydrolase protein [Gymnopilus junonius]
MFLRRNRSASNNNTNSRQRTVSTPSALRLPLPPLHEPSKTTGKTSLATSDYAKQCREIMELYWALRGLHIATVFDLPRVVVVGGQSSGKSFLVEAVSGINVPRDSGTCTRCPMDCTMSSNASSWSCTITLRREFDEAGHALSNPTVEPFGRVIENRSLVELQIRRAQAAILSPHRPASDFYDMDEAALKENAKNDAAVLLFSRNVVEVKVKDPNATDLTLDSQCPQDGLIDLVRDLVEEYIRKENTLIVIAIPMSDDIQNIQAVTLAKDPRVDPRRERTIGVLTKPDALSKGATGGRSAWRAILEGQESEHNTKHGYYCVRLPDDAERQRKINRAEAEKISSDFFAATSPWSEMADRSRFGIPNFVKDVSGLLIELIERNLPELRKAVERELAKCFKEIEALPPALDKDPLTEISLRITAFCKDENKDRYDSFKNDIQMTTPDFWPFEDLDSNSTYSLVHSHCQQRGLAEVRNAIKGSITWELPGHVPHDAIKELVLQYTKLWKDPSLLCFQDVITNTSSLLDELLKSHFGRYKELERFMRTLVFKERDLHRDETRIVLDKFLELETIYNQPYITRSLVEARNYPHSIPQPLCTRLAPVHLFPSKTFPRVKNDGPTSSTPADEIGVMADVQAYFQLAYRRLIDYVPLTIEHQLNQAFARDINSTLLQAIFKDTDEEQVDVTGLIKEDPAIERVRTELEDRKVRLLQIKEKLDTFRRGSS